MKQSGYSIAAVLALTVGTWVAASACPDQAKTSAASAQSSSTCTAAAAAKCTPEQAAACKAKNASGVSAVTASSSGAGVCPHAAAAGSAAKCPAMTGAATTASVGTVDAVMASGGACSAHGATAASGSCPHGASAVTAGTGSCPAHGASAVTAGSSSCSAHGASAAAGSGSCSSKGAAAAGGSCSAHGVGVTSSNVSGTCGGQGLTMGVNGDMDTNCDACSGMQACRAELDAMGATVQVVPLKNGVMYVYTADTPSHIRSVQATLAHRDARVNALLAEGDKAKLCPECKTMRGAIASGKMTRELVKVESGCLMMLTSSDPTMVLKLHDLSGAKTLARAKL